RNRDDGAIPKVAIVCGPINICFKPFGSFLRPFIQPCSTSNEIMQKMANPIRRYPKKLGVAPGHLVGAIIPQNLTKDACGNSAMYQFKRWENSFHHNSLPAGNLVGLYSSIGGTQGKHRTVARNCTDRSLTSAYDGTVGLHLRLTSS